MLKKTALVLASCMAFSMMAKDVVIKFSHVVAESTPKGQMAIKFKELVEKNSNGTMKVEVYPNSQLFTDGKVLKAMLLGDVQLAAPSLSKFDRFTKKVQLFDLPFLFDDIAAVERFQKSDKGQEILTSLEKKGLLGLGYIHNGLKQMSGNAPVKVPADLKGKKVRIQASDVLKAQYEAVGALPIKKPFSEVFTLLQTKAIDGTENPWANTYTKKFYEVQDYITETDHGLLGYMVVTSKKFMDSLTDEQRKIFVDAIKESVDYGNGLAVELAKEHRQKIIDSGRTKVEQLTPEQRAEWVKVMKPVWAQFAEEIGQEYIDAAVKANEK